MSKPAICRFARGPKIVWMDWGQTLPLDHGLDLELVYAEDSIPIFKAEPKGRRPELWTSSEYHPHIYYRCGRWPKSEKAVNFDKLINKVHSTRGLYDQVLSVMCTGSYSFEEGRA